MSKTTDIATIAVVALLGAGGFLIYKNRNEIGDFFGGIGKGVSDFTDGIGKGVGEFTDGIGSWYGETVTNIQQGVDDLGKNVGGFFDGVVDGFTQTVTGIQSGIAGALDGAGDFFGETVTGIQSGIAGLIGGIGDFFSGKRDSEDMAKESATKPATSNYPTTPKSIYDNATRIIGVDGRPLEERGQQVEPVPVKDVKTALQNYKNAKNRLTQIKELLGLE